MEAEILASVSQLPEAARAQNIVYVLRSVSDPDLFYCGYTNNIHRRLRQHNGLISGGGQYTSANRPWKLACIIFSELPMTKSEALRVEYWTKAKNYTSCGSKNHHLASQIPTSCPVAKRMWLVRQAATELERECSIFILDEQMKDR